MSKKDTKATFKISQEKWERFKEKVDQQSGKTASARLRELIDQELDERVDPQLREEKIKGVKVGRVWRVKKSEVKNYLERGR